MGPRSSGRGLFVSKAFGEGIFATKKSRCQLVRWRDAAYLVIMTASLNLIKLCVGAEGPDDLEHWQAQRFGSDPAVHVTRMWPTREAELLAGGSIYWVFKGVLLARQRLLRLDERVGDDGIRRCALVLDRKLVRVAAVPRRPFQGWRYLNGTDAPPDLPAGRASEDQLPPSVAAALAEMGLV